MLWGHWTIYRFESSFINLFHFESSQLRSPTVGHTHQYIHTNTLVLTLLVRWTTYNSTTTTFPVLFTFTFTFSRFFLNSSVTLKIAASHMLDWVRAKSKNKNKLIYLLASSLHSWPTSQNHSQTENWFNTSPVFCSVLMYHLKGHWKNHLTLFSLERRLSLRHSCVDSNPHTPFWCTGIKLKHYVCNSRNHWMKCFS